MELSLSLMQSIMTMFIWVAVGYIVVKAGLVTVENSKVLSSLTVYVFCPCMIFNAFQIELTEERIFGLIAAVLFAFAVYFVWIALSKILRKPLKLDPVDEASLVYGNVGNLVLPLVAMTLGDEMVFYASAIQVPFNFLFWTHGISVMQGRSQFQWKKIISNFNLIAVVLGIVFLIFQLHLPSIVQASISGLSALVAPCSMMVVGMVLAGTSIKSIFTCKRAYGILFGRLILYPLIALGLLYISGITVRHPALVSVLTVTVMSLSAPTASNVAQLAVVFDQKPTEASIYNILSLFFCIITLPLMIWIYQMIFS